MDFEIKRSTLLILLLVMKFYARCHFDASFVNHRSARSATFTVFSIFCFTDQVGAGNIRGNLTLNDSIGGPGVSEGVQSFI